MELSSLNSYCVRGSVLSLSADLIFHVHIWPCCAPHNIYEIYFGCSGLFMVYLIGKGRFCFLAFESHESWNTGNKIFFSKGVMFARLDTLGYYFGGFEFGSRMSSRWMMSTWSYICCKPEVNAISVVIHPLVYKPTFSLPKNMFSFYTTTADIFRLLLFALDALVI